MISGVDRVNLTLSIHPDNIPELDEAFTVELTNVSEKNERLREGAVSNCLIFMNLCDQCTWGFNLTLSLP